MSRTDNTSTRPRNPAKYFISFSGETGNFSYWDGNKNVLLESVDFIAIDTISSVTGWSDSHGAKIWSNYFKSTKDTVNIKCGNKDLMVGTYNEDKEKIKAAGGKFQTNIFALVDIDGEWCPAVIQFTGAALSAWSSFVEETKMFRIYQSLVVARMGDQEKKGRVVFYRPTFTLEPLPDELKEAADDFDKNQLKPFLGAGN